MILRISWSPDGKMIASPSVDQTVRIWDVEAGSVVQILKGHGAGVNHVAWRPDGAVVATCSFDHTIRIWDVASGTCLSVLRDHSDDVGSVAWSPDGSRLASASSDRTIRLWDTASWRVSRVLQGHAGVVIKVAWSPDGARLASGSDDHTVRIWDPENGSELRALTKEGVWIVGLEWSPDGRRIAFSGGERVFVVDLDGQGEIRLEGPTDLVSSVSFSYDGRLLASKSMDGNLRLWRTDSWRKVAEWEESASNFWPPGLAFSPQSTRLATLGECDRVVRVWELDPAALLPDWAAGARGEYYTNAKIVLLGDSGVGKSGLALVLAGEPFRATESTHARKVVTFSNEDVEVPDGIEHREIILWDMAGQTGYRMIHHLHLGEVAVAVVVFDARSETDPFSGVRYCDRILRQAQSLQGGSALPFRKILVAARSDRGTLAVSQQRIEAMARELGFTAYYPTSAKENLGIAELARGVREAIPWESLPKASSTQLFHTIKRFLIAEKNAGRHLSTVDELYRAFLAGQPGTRADFRAEFETCIRLIAAAGLIRKFSFGDRVLLHPELIDAYASSMLAAARTEPDGLGSIAEEVVRTGRFAIPSDVRLRDKGEEALLLISTVEDLLRHEIALREESPGGPILIFPSEMTREWERGPNPEGTTVVYVFDGLVQSIYTTLVVRLSHSDIFRRKNIWKNAVEYSAVSGSCGIYVRELNEGRGEVSLFFDSSASEETRYNFEECVRVHLSRKATPGTTARRRIHRCSDCGTEITDRQSAARLSRGYSSMKCPVCSTEILILDREERIAAAQSSMLKAIDDAANRGRDRQAAESMLQGKIATSDFDVFLCHNSADKPEVKRIASILNTRGIRAWLDEWELQPGIPWQRSLEKQIKTVRSAAVFVGYSGVGPWQDHEIWAILNRFVHRKCPIIPVILKDCTTKPELPLFLESYTWVNFRQSEPDPIDHLVWGITGKRAS